MNDAARLLDGDLSAPRAGPCPARPPWGSRKLGAARRFLESEDELTVMPQRLKHDAALRDEISAQQLMRDAVVGIRAPDDGYSLRILARVRGAQNRG